jgi:flagellar motor switch/type III secretory pathway protein FliN
VNIEVRDWLPASIASHELVATRIAEAVSTWSRRWFAKGAVRLGDLTPVGAGARDFTQGDWRVHADAVAMRLSHAMIQRLQEAALDVGLEGVILSEADRQLIAGFTDKVLDDLALLIQGLLGEAASLPMVTAVDLSQQGGVVAELADDRGPLLTLALPQAALIRLCKLNLSVSGAAKIELGGLVTAILPSELMIEASVGVARMSLADLRGLEVGDVVVLDRAWADGGVISLAGSNQPFARCKLGQSDDSVALILQALQ